jgi:hypothetical protein
MRVSGQVRETGAQGAARVSEVGAIPKRYLDWGFADEFGVNDGTGA